MIEVTPNHYRLSDILEYGLPDAITTVYANGSINRAEAVPAWDHFDLEHRWYCDHESENSGCSGRSYSTSEGNVRLCGVHMVREIKAEIELFKNDERVTNLLLST